MSQVHLEKFYDIAANDQVLSEKLIGDGNTSPEQFCENAVAEAKELGLEFSVDEAYAWVAAQDEIKASGELNDTQLENVAGGKGKKVAKDINKEVTAAGDWVEGAEKSVEERWKRLKHLFS